MTKTTTPDLPKNSVPTSHAINPNKETVANRVEPDATVMEAMRKDNSDDAAKAAKKLAEDVEKAMLDNIARQDTALTETLRSIMEGPVKSAPKKEGK